MKRNDLVAEFSGKDSASAAIAREKIQTGLVASERRKFSLLESKRNASQRLTNRMMQLPNSVTRSDTVGNQAVSRIGEEYLKASNKRKQSTQEHALKAMDRLKTRLEAKQRAGVSP